MRTFHSFLRQNVATTREARLLALDGTNGPQFRPADAPQPQGPEAPKEPINRAPIDPRTPEQLAGDARLQATIRRMNAMIQQGQREDDIRGVQQRIVDLIMQVTTPAPGATREEIRQLQKDQTRLLQDANNDLKAKGYSMSLKDGIVSVKPYQAPRQLSPDEAAKKRRLEDLTYQIRQVEKEIGAAGGDIRMMGAEENKFAQVAQKKGRKDAAILSQSLQGTMRDAAPELRQLMDKWRRLKSEFRGVQSGRIPVRAGEANRTEDPIKKDYNPIEGGKKNFDLKENLRSMPPAMAQEVTKLPERVQEPVARILSGMSEAERVQYAAMLGKLNGLDVETQRALGSFVGPDGKITIPPGAERNPETANAAQFLHSLNPVERAMYEKTVRVSREFIENGASLATESKTDQQKINSYLKKWQKAKTEEDRQMAEGFLLMEGVDTDASDLEAGEIIMTPENNRFFGVLMGLFKVCMAFLGQTFGNKTLIDKQIADAKGPKGGPVPADELPPAEREKEMKGLEKKLLTAVTKSDLLDQEIKKREGKLKDVDPANQPKMKEQLDGLKKQLAELKAAIRVLQDRLKELRAASAPKTAEKPQDEKESPEKEALRKFGKEIENYVSFLLGNKDQKHSMFDMNASYDLLDATGKQAAAKLIQEANLKLSAAGTKFSLKLENDDLRFDDGEPKSPPKA